MRCECYNTHMSNLLSPSPPETYDVISSVSIILLTWLGRMKTIQKADQRKHAVNTKIVQKLRVGYQRCTWRLHHQSAFWDAFKVFLGFSFCWALPLDPSAGALPLHPRWGHSPRSPMWARVHTPRGRPFHQFLDLPLLTAVPEKKSSGDGIFSEPFNPGQKTENPTPGQINWPGPRP